MYKIGQKICLWHEKVTLGKVTVLKEVVVTITELKTGVPGEFSRKPVSLQSIRGIGDDGKVYEKHWECWPEAQLNDFAGQWSMREDEGDFWIPKEAVHAHSMIRFVNRKQDPKIVRVDTAGNPIVPKGDVQYCAEHDNYFYAEGDSCFFCDMAARRLAQA